MALLADPPAAQPALDDRMHLQPGRVVAAATGAARAETARRGRRAPRSAARQVERLAARVDRCSRWTAARPLFDHTFECDRLTLNWTDREQPMYIPRKFALTADQTAEALRHGRVRAPGQPRRGRPAGDATTPDLRRAPAFVRRPRLPRQPALACRRSRVGCDLLGPADVHLAQLLRDENGNRQGRSHLELRAPQRSRPAGHPRRPRLGAQPGHHADQPPRGEATCALAGHRRAEDLHAIAATRDRRRRARHRQSRGQGQDVAEPTRPEPGRRRRRPAGSPTRRRISSSQTGWPPSTTAARTRRAGDSPARSAASAAPRRRRRAAPRPTRVRSTAASRRWRRRSAPSALG